MYCQLAALGLSDPIFHADNFARLPVRLISDTLEINTKISKTKANVNSIATAKMGAMVACALGGKTVKVKASDFLPYELEEKDQIVTDETREALKWALKSQRLPGVIVAMIGTELA